VFLFFVPGKLMAALAYRDDKILARKLLSDPFFCLTPAEPFFRSLIAATNARSFLLAFSLS
jgi:hypothetical protein